MAERDRAPRHPLEVKPLSSNARFKQSRFPIFNPLPCKVYYVSSSGGGKSSAAISAIEVLIPLFSNFAVFSHTIKVDPSFDGLLAKIKRRLESLDIDTEDPENDYKFENLSDLGRVMNKQAAVIKEEKEMGQPLSQMLIYIDDMLGDLRFNKHLDALFSRGRHLGISVFLTSQVFRGASSTIRKNIDLLVCFRLNQTELVAVREEVVGADVSSEQFDELYKRGTAAPHDMLVIKLKERDKDQKFFRNYTHRLIIS